MSVRPIPKFARELLLHPAALKKKKLKSFKDEELTAIIERVLTKAKEKHKEAWEIACYSLSELHVRPYAKAHPNELLSYRVNLIAKSKLCFIDTEYSVEAAGIERRERLHHLYPYTVATMSIVEQWRKSKIELSFSDYIEKYVPSDDKQELIKSSVKYLEPHERENYTVTFKHKKLKIDGKTLQDGLYMYVLSADQKNLLVGEKRRGRFQHTSFFAAAPVACAGYMIIENKRIVLATLKSGHYKPTKEHGELLRSYLSDKKRLGKEYAQDLHIKEWTPS